MILAFLLFHTVYSLSATQDAALRIVLSSIGCFNSADCFFKPTDVSLCGRSSRIDCNANDVTALNIHRAHLTGTLPTDIGVLTGLTTLELSWGLMTGTMPPDIGRLTQLRVLNVSANQFDGRIPEELRRLTSLEILDVSQNRWTGTISTSLGLLTGLTSLWLQGARFTGTIPSELGALSSVTSFRVDYNSLTGTIPAELGRRYDWFSAFGNRLQGDVPQNLFARACLLQSVHAQRPLTNCLVNCTPYCCGDENGASRLDECGVCGGPGLPCATNAPTPSPSPAPTPFPTPISTTTISTTTTTTSTTTTATTTTAAIAPSPSPSHSSNPETESSSSSSARTFSSQQIEQESGSGLLFPLLACAAFLAICALFCLFMAFRQKSTNQEPRECHDGPSPSIAPVYSNVPSQTYVDVSGVSSSAYGDVPNQRDIDGATVYRNAPTIYGSPHNLRTEHYGSVRHSPVIGTYQDPRYSSISVGSSHNEYELGELGSDT